MYSTQIKTFIQVADRGSFSKAAEDLFVTPASIMKQMNALENHLEITLLKRTNQGIELTDAGKYIYNSAKKLIAESDEILCKAKTIEQQSVKTIRVGSSFLNPGSVLVDLWNKVSPDSTEYRIKLVPYDDHHERILNIVSSLGSKLDFMVGVFGSQQMLSMSNYYELGHYQLSIAVPRTHRLVSKAKLTLSDLHGEHLIIVKTGDSLHLDDLREVLKMTHPQIILEDAHYFYDMETFNFCEITGSFLLTLDAWADIHPSLVTLPIDWNHPISYGLLFSKDISDVAGSFLNIIKSAGG